MPTVNITSNTNQMNKSAWYGSLPYKCRARISDRNQGPTTKYQQCPLSIDQHNKSSTLPRPHKLKLNMQKMEDKKNMESAELKNKGERDSMMESPCWKMNSNTPLPSLKSQTLPRPKRKLPTEYILGSNRNVRILSLYKQNDIYDYFRCFLISIKHPAAGLSL